VNVKDIYREHTVKHIGARKGQTTDVVLRPYKKRGAYQVPRSGDGNTLNVEIPCSSLDEVAYYLEQGGFLVRMKSQNPRAEGLYASDEIVVIR